MLALTITGIAFLNAGVMENRLVGREVHKNKAFYIAEGGLERTLWNLKQHFKIDFELRWPKNSGAWPTGFVNGIPVSSGSFPWTIQYGPGGSLPGDLGGGSYVVTLEYIPAEDEIRIESKGTFEDTSRTVQIYTKPGQFFPFDTAIFAGESAVAGSIINGNVRVHGSIVILAETVGGPPGGPVVTLMDLLGNAGIRNNYEGMPDELALTDSGGRRIPELPLVLYDEEPYFPDEVQSLKATLRVRDGAVELGGSVTIGEENILLPSIKGFMDGLYVDRGFTLSGAAHLYSDDYEESSGLGGISFPSLLVAGPETSGVPRIDYLKSSLNSISLPDTITEISSLTPSFWANSAEFHENVDPGDLPTSPQGDNYIIWNQVEGLLTISGIISLEAASLDLGKAHETIEYSGKGMIVVARRDSINPESIVGEIRVHGDFLVAEGEYIEEGSGGFPNNVLGLVTGDLHIAGPGEDHLVATGAFFAENAIHSSFQNEIAGTFVSNFFDIASHVPRIYQVPKLATNVPEGMPGGPPVWALITSEWSES